MSSGSGRIVNSWRLPERLLMKAVAIKLHDDGLRGNALVREFEKLIPDWQSYFDKPIDENALAQRADKARRYPSEFEAVRPYWRAAKEIVRRRTRLGKRAVAKLVAAIEP